MPPKNIDYSKWDSLDCSDDEEDSSAAPKAEAARAQEHMIQQQIVAQQAKAEAEGLTQAIDAAAMASSTGNHEALDQMMAQAQIAAPLQPEMEAVLSTLPEAARIAARASAAAQAGAAAGGKKEPTLAELLKAQSISLDGSADDPGLEDIKDFFENVDEAAAAEKRLAEVERRARVNTAAAVAAATAAMPQQPQKLDPERVEFLD